MFINGCTFVWHYELYESPYLWAGGSNSGCARVYLSSMFDVTMIPLLPLAATAILFYPSASPSLLARSIIAEPTKGIVSNSTNGNQQLLNA